MKVLWILSFKKVSRLLGKGGEAGVGGAEDLGQALAAPGVGRVDGLGGQVRELRLLGPQIPEGGGVAGLGELLVRVGKAQAAGARLWKELL